MRRLPAAALCRRETLGAVKVELACRTGLGAAPDPKPHGSCRSNDRRASVSQSSPVAFVGLFFLQSGRAVRRP